MAMAAQRDQATPTGFEPATDSSGNSQGTGESGAEYGALSGESDQMAAPTASFDPDLSAVVAAWPDLPAAVRAGIVAMVQASLKAPLNRGSLTQHRCCGHEAIDSQVTLSGPSQANVAYRTLDPSRPAPNEGHRDTWAS